MSDENLINLKAHDNDKYLALHFAPPDKKAQLAALFNFHYEISQVPLEVSEPMIGMIKLQWWRDCLEEILDGKPPRPHPILRELAHSNANLKKLETVIDTYEKLLDGWQPRDFAELEDFITHTQVIIFEQAANILESTNPENIARAYAYNFMARRISTNAGQKFATDPATMAQKLTDKSKQLSSPHNSVFAKITNYYNQNSKAQRWKLLLKLAFSKTNFL